MSDRDEILEVIATYAQAVDDQDVDRVLTCFTEDGRIDFEGGRSSGEGHTGIRAAFEAAFASTPALQQPAASTHLMGNTLVTLDGQEASAVTQCVAFLASTSTAAVTTRGIRYSDRFVRTGDGWRIAHRVHRSLWSTEAPGSVH